MHAYTYTFSNGISERARCVCAADGLGKLNNLYSWVYGCVRNVLAEYNYLKYFYFTLPSQQLHISMLNFIGFRVPLI